MREEANSTHPMLKRFTNSHFNAQNYIGEVVAHVDTRGLNEALEQLKGYKQTMNEVMGGLIFKKYDNILEIDEHMKKLGERSDRLRECVEEYKIALQTLEVNIVEDVTRVQCRKNKELLNEESPHIEAEGSHNVRASKWFEEFPERISLFLSESKYAECMELFEEYQHSKSNHDSIGLIVLKECELAFGRLVLALSKELTINPHNTSAIKYLKELGFVSKAIVAYLSGKAKILRIKLREHFLIVDSFKKEEQICKVFLTYLLETRQDFESNFPLPVEKAALYGNLAKWMLDELRKFVILLVEELFKLKTKEELSHLSRSIIEIFKSFEKQGLYLTLELQRLLLPYYKVMLKK